MKFRYSLMKYAEKYGVTRASRKYNKGASYIYFWKARYDGSIESLACRSRRPHSHPNQHTEAELKLIRDMRGAIPSSASWNFGADCASGDTAAASKVYGVFSDAKDWRRRKNPGRNTRPSPMNRCSTPASASRLT